MRALDQLKNIQAYIMRVTDGPAPTITEAVEVLDAVEVLLHKAIDDVENGRAVDVRPTVCPWCHRKLHTPALPAVSDCAGPLHHVTTVPKSPA